MSSKTYHLRTRVDTGVAAQLRARTRGVPAARSPVTFTRDPAPHLEGSNIPVTDAVPPLYSDIAASRPPSPRRETTTVPSASPNVVGDRVLPQPEQVVKNIPVNKKHENLTSSDLSDSSQRQDETPWTTVRRRRARSLSSLDKARKEEQRVPRSANLTAEQRRAVEVATRTLTDQQRQQIRRRHQAAAREHSLSSRGEGPSNLKKGKGIDPNEWGDVNISQESLDLAAQAAALDSFKQPKPRKKPHRESGHKDERRQPRRPAEYQPVSQIAPKSYLGTALKNIGRAFGSRHRRSPSPTPSRSSSSS